MFNQSTAGLSHLALPTGFGQRDIESPLQMKNEAKQILNIPEPQNATKYRNVVAQRKTKGGNQYWIRVVQQVGASGIAIEQEANQINPNTPDKIEANELLKPKLEDLSNEDNGEDKQSYKQDSLSPEGNDKSKVFLFNRSDNNMPSIVTIEDKNPAELFRGASNSLVEIEANFGDDSRNDETQQSHSDI